MSSGGGWSPGKLWSLWDIMQILQGGRLIVSINALASMGRSGDEGTILAIPVANHRDMIGHVEFVCSELEKLELASSLVTAREILSVLTNDIEIKNASEIPAIPGREMSDTWALLNPLSRSIYVRATSELLGRFRDEMSLRTVLAIAPSLTTYFNPNAPLFGEGVFEKFGSSREDIEEAGKCLALGRATATVFHLMRALESATKIIGAKLGATIVDEHGRGLAWGVIANNMKPKIDGMITGSDEQIRWYRVQQDLVAVNRAWRVPTNHPKETYTPDQAQEIFDATKAFMKELAPLV